MTRTTLSALSLALLLPASGRPETPAEAALAKLKGTWVCIEQAGQKPTREIKLIVDKAGTYRMGGLNGDSSDLALQGGVDGKLRFDTKKDPPRIELVGSKLTIPGVYKIEGDRLTLLVNPKGGQPTSFEKADGVIHVFIREGEKK
jgi:uncharacterized protein (TIGR03067 family)